MDDTKKSHHHQINFSKLIKPSLKSQDENEESPILFTNTSLPHLFPHDPSSFIFHKKNTINGKLEMRSVWWISDLDENETKEMEEIGYESEQDIEEEEEWDEDFIINCIFGKDFEHNNKI